MSDGQIVSRAPAPSMRLVAGQSVMALQRLLPADRRGDPLGAGLPRPPPPVDTDVFTAVPPDERLTIDQLRRTIQVNTSHESYESREELSLDVDLILALDKRIDYKVFIVDGEIHSREDIFNSYALAEMGVLPEAVFARMVVMEVPDSRGRHKLTLIDGDTELPAGEVIETKFFIGRRRWDDFRALEQVCRGVLRVHATHHVLGITGPPAAQAMGMLLGAAAPVQPEPEPTVPDVDAFDLPDGSIATTADRLRDLEDQLWEMGRVVSELTERLAAIDARLAVREQKAPSC